MNEKQQKRNFNMENNMQEHISLRFLYMANFFFSVFSCKSQQSLQYTLISSYLENKRLIYHVSLVYIRVVIFKQKKETFLFYSKIPAFVCYYAFMNTMHLHLCAQFGRKISFFGRGSTDYES